MEKLSTYVLNADAAMQPVTEKIKSKLFQGNIECVDEPAKNCKIAIAVWPEKAPIENILQQIHELSLRDFKIIVLNLNNNISALLKWQLMQSGANDIVDWNEQGSTITFIYARIQRWKLIDNLLLGETASNKMIGDSSAWKRFLRRIIEAALFTTGSVLLTGQSGTGKELTARFIHAIDRRKDKGELVLLDCTTIVPELSGSEFYGHEKGAFTNAFYTREGAFALAHNGSLFLDELGELPLSMQAGLLRVIQEKTYKRVGSNTWRTTNFRLISATNKDLKKEIAGGHFREDLYFRIASAVFTLPTLNERKEDIPELARHFLREELKTIVAPEIDSAVMNYLINKDYPGNIRELKHLIARIAMRYTGEGLITIGDIPEDELQNLDGTHVSHTPQNQSIQQSIRLAIASGKDLAGIKNEVANMAMEIALEDCGGNLKLAARKLNVEVRTLQYIRKKNNGIKC